MKKVIVSGLLLFLFCIPAFSAASVAVSVLYFENLSEKEKSPYLRKALSEMIISSLSGVKGLSLVEREQLEKITSELALDQSGLIAEDKSAKAGEMLGANYIVTGSYIVNRRDITITFKLLDVEKGTIVKTDRVNGETRKVITLTDSLAREVVEGLSSIINGLGKISKATTEPLDLPLEKVTDYGMALDVSDKGEYTDAKNLLKKLLADVPSFSLASNKLSDLEKRIQTYDKKHEEEISKLKAEPINYMNFIQMTSNYMMAMEYTKLLMYCLENRKNPPVAPQGSLCTGEEMLEFYIVTAANSLQKYDLVMSEGEAFLKKFPGKMYYMSVKRMVESAAQETEQIRAQNIATENEVKAALAECEKESKANRDLCYYDIAMIYFNGKMYRQALEFFSKSNLNKVTEARNLPQDIILYSVFICYYQLMEKTDATRIFDLVKSQYPQSQMIQAMQPLMNYFRE